MLDETPTYHDVSPRNLEPSRRIDIAVDRRPAGWMQELTGRSPMKSPGKPSLRREIEREFWKQIATGITSEAAAAAVDVSQAVGSRWFRHGGGMPPMNLMPTTGRYLSFAEREDIALLRAKGFGVRSIAREIDRSPSTVSRELRRNAATRCGRLEYRASVAQWKSEPVAQRPKPCKLVENERLRDYVQDRLDYELPKQPRDPTDFAGTAARVGCNGAVISERVLDGIGIAPSPPTSADPEG